ncbi:MAG: hypothetical protein MUE44_21365 [Oscillatoriaceae cyanobacterium Prado104]|jgi:hypothetical protein|nr:hypothetical protein [Oscillatoriaceae cyanobacterium Prado104]
MANNMRQTGGKFAPKSDTPRKVRSVNLTDAAWEWLARVAKDADLTRNDYLEALAQSNSPFMETEIQPSIEMAGRTGADAATLLNQLKAKRKKTKCDLRDIEALLELL